MTASTGMDALRSALQGLSGREITNALLYEIMGVDSEEERARLRRSLTHLVRKRELLRQAPGTYLYNPKATSPQAGEMCSRIWRAIRASKPGWSKLDLSLTTRVSHSHLSQYVNWLEDQGYVERHGRKGNVVLYRGTGKAREQRETPFPPREARDPFAEARAACARLVRVMMTRDLYQPSACKEVVKECAAIMARFGEPKQPEVEHGQ